MAADEERDAAGRGAAHGATSAGEPAGADVARLSRSGTRRGEDAGLGSREIIARLLVDAGIGALMEAHARARCRRVARSRMYSPLKRLVRFGVLSLPTQARAQRLSASA